MIKSIFFDGGLCLTRIDMQYYRVFHHVGVSSLSVICMCLRTMQVVKHQVPFCL